MEFDSSTQVQQTWYPFRDLPDISLHLPYHFVICDTGKKLRGHNCVWHSQLPEWVENGTFTPAELAFVVERHCATLVGHYRGQV